MTEQEIQNSIKKFIEINGGYCIRTNSGKIPAYNHKGARRFINLGEKGTPDLHACVKSVMIGIEVKKDSKEVQNFMRKVKKYCESGEIKESWKREIAQYLKGCEIIKAGGQFMVVSSVNEVEAELRKLKLL